MKRACVVAVAGLVLCGALPASAQDQLVTTSARDAERRWDVVGFTGWRGVNKSDIAPDWDRWYDVAAFGVSTSRHLTRHVKIDVDLSTTSIGRVDEELFGVPGLPYYEFREYQFRRTTLATALAYQFFENRWVHPFLGVGLEGVRETERLEVDRVPVRGGVLSAVPATTRIAYGRG